MGQGHYPRGVLEEGSGQSSALRQDLAMISIGNRLEIKATQLVRSGHSAEIPPSSLSSAPVMELDRRWQDRGRRWRFLGAMMRPGIWRASFPMMTSFDACIGADSVKNGRVDKGR
jgi:hypothetical protein